MEIIFDWVISLFCKVNRYYYTSGIKDCINDLSEIKNINSELHNIF